MPLDLAGGGPPNPLAGPAAALVGLVADFVAVVLCLGWGCQFYFGLCCPRPNLVGDGILFTAFWSPRATPPGPASTGVNYEKDLLIPPALSLEGLFPPPGVLFVGEAVS